MSKQSAISPDLADRALDLAGGCYVERDGGDYYVLTARDARLGEGFADRADALRFLCWLGGDPMPVGWRVTTAASWNFAEVSLPNRTVATIWLRSVEGRFPSWKTI